VAADWARAAVSRLEAASDEIAAEKLVEDLLRQQFASTPDEVAAQLVTAAAERPIAAYALWRLSPQQALRLLGPEIAADALIRFHQPHVPGWWDGWSPPAFAWAVEEWDVADVMTYLDRAVAAAPSDTVLAWIGSGPVFDALATRAEDFRSAFASRAHGDRRWRTALDAADGSG
jgi:hypothetical protein